tara:strand:- start:91 stop:699 length:609 start_codon:yes stop_codon:yes gene_type:complete
MKVNRQNIREEYSTTAGWVRDFSNGLSKNADYLNNLKSILKKRNDFDTIDEKMADLKSRVGFDLVKNVERSLGDNIKEAGCGCNSCDTCGLKSGEESEKKTESISSDDALVSEIINVLKYIKDFAKDRPEAGYGAVMTHCREHPKLGFDRIERRLNSKFKDAVLDIINKHKKDPEAVEYISGVDMGSSGDDDLADYYSHANG